MQQNHLEYLRYPGNLKKNILQFQTFYFNFKGRLTLRNVSISLRFTEQTHHTGF